MIKDFREAQRAAEDPQRFMEVAAYIATLPETQNGRQQRDTLLQVCESVVTAATYGINASEDYSNVFATMNAADVPAILANASGRVIRLNEQALERYPEAIYGTLKDLNIRTDSGEHPFAAFGAPSRRHDGPTDVKLIEAIDLNSNQSVTICYSWILPDRNGDPAVLVYFSERSSQARVQALVEGKGLTQAETQVLTRFVDGLTLAKIAEERARSPETVRRQFYTALEKAGYTSQADLLRDLLFQHQVPLAAPEVAKPENAVFRKLLLPRQGGRVLDVSISGDSWGRPMVFATFMGAMRLPTPFSELLKQKGIMVLNVARPGFGSTSLPADGQSEEDCFVEDVTAMLQQLQLDEVSLYAASFGFVPSLRLARQLGIKVRSIFATSIIPPRPFVKAGSKDAPLPLDAKTTFSFAPRFQRFLFRAFLWYANLVGWQKALTAIIKDEEALEYAMDPHHLEIGEASFKAAIAHGFGRAVKDFGVSHGNWLPELDACPCPIYLVQATEDAFSPIEAVRALVDYASEKFKFVEGAGTSYSLHIKNPDIFLNAIEDALNCNQ